MPLSATPRLLSPEHRAEGCSPGFPLQGPSQPGLRALML